MKWRKIKFDHKQLGGDCLPNESPMTFIHEDVAGPPRPWYFRLILSSCTFLQGTNLLHFKVTATFELDVPHMLLNVTLLICTFELSCLYATSTNNMVQQCNCTWIFVIRNVLVTYQVAARRSWAVLLINQYRIMYILHVNITKKYVRSHTRQRRCPSFDPCTILRTDKRAISHFYPCNNFSRGSTKTTNADSMSRSTYNVGNVDVSASSNHGNTVIACLNNGSWNFDVGW